MAIQCRPGRVCGSVLLTKQVLGVTFLGQRSEANVPMKKPLVYGLLNKT